MSTALIVYDGADPYVWEVANRNDDTCKPRGGRPGDVDAAMRIANAFDDGAFWAVSRLAAAGLVIDRRSARELTAPDYATIRDFLFHDNGFHLITSAGVALRHTRWLMNLHHKPIGTHLPR